MVGNGSLSRPVNALRRSARNLSTWDLVMDFRSIKSAPEQKALSDVEFTMRTRVLMKNGGCSVSRGEFGACGIFFGGGVRTHSLSKRTCSKQSRNCYTEQTLEIVLKGMSMACGVPYLEQVCGYRVLCLGSIQREVCHSGMGRAGRSKECLRI